MDKIQHLRGKIHELGVSNVRLIAQYEILSSIKAAVIESPRPERWPEEIDFRLSKIARAQGDNGTRLIAFLHEIAVLERKKPGARIKRFLLLTFIRFVSVLKRLYKKAF